MVSITIPAYLNLCRCGKHGNIALPDGTMSEEFYSKETARTHLYMLLRQEKVTHAEALCIDQMITESKNLAHTDEYADRVIQIICDTANEVLSEHGESECELAEERPKYYM